jgi:hypothetical protein
MQPPQSNVFCAGGRAISGSFLPVNGRHYKLVIRFFPVERLGGANKKIAPAFRDIVKLVCKLVPCLAVEINHYVPAKYNVEFFFEGKGGRHKVEGPEYHLVFDSLRNLAGGGVYFLEIIQAPGWRKLRKIPVLIDAAPCLFEDLVGDVGRDILASHIGFSRPKNSSMSIARV